MEKILINGLTLAYDRRGSGTPLLLIHGFPLDHGCWQPFAANLEANFDLIMPDLRGFGLSEAPEIDYSIEQMAADLAVLLDRINIQKAFVVGHSMGGYVALAFANAYPARVLGLGLLGSQASPDQPERKTGRYATADLVALHGVSQVAGMAEKLSSDPQLSPFFLEMILRQPSRGIIGALKAMANRADARHFVAFFNFPVVLVHGLTDGLIPVERSREMKSLIPQADLTELPGVGHSPMLEAPAETARALLRVFVQ
jgi:3-oxoadipate enol-lactonase